MADRRMFNKTLLLGNEFTTLHPNAQLLYINMSLLADDDGICGNTRMACRLCSGSKKHLQALVDGGWILEFEQEVVAIVHWHVHNQIRKDRYKPSIYIHVTRRLHKNEDGLYERLPDGCQNDNQSATQESIAQESKEKEKISQYSIGKKSQGEQTQAEPVCPPPEAADAADDLLDIDYDEIVDRYNRFCKNLKPCEGVTDLLRKKIQNCYRAGHDLGSLTQAFYTASTSDFLGGENDRNWKADLKWIMTPYHLDMIKAGKYHDWS